MALEKEITLPHKGPFREEVSWLRCIFGLRNILPTEPLSLQCLSVLPTLPGFTIKDMILIALDVEAPLSKQTGHLDLSKNFQVGLSTFDTRLLPSIVLATAESYIQQTANALQTYNFCGGAENYCAKASRRFLFGESEMLLPDQIKANLNATIAKDRNIVLVVYGGHQDLLLLKDINMDILPVCIIDIQKASQSVLQLSRRLSLEELVTTLSCPFKYLHIAGNDANFTLRAMLLLVVKDSQHDAALNGLSQTQLSVLQAIAQSTTLNSATWLDKPDEENWKRAQQARFTTTEEERQEKNRKKKIRKLARGR
ncbi:hypothetical protein BGZ60DRAFT_538068 [Tricladium varicosporioides]|nr:hypothetical protein BGZ60DRAFT_538068 [Hymenoscyphus varicosporioides]